MRLLLDTHVALWCVVGDPRLSAPAKASILGADQGVWVSAASIWEIAIKFSLQRKSDPLPFSGQQAIGYFGDAGFQFLDIRPAHAAAVERLAPLHPDPFDRLLIAQAQVESMQLMTRAASLAAYGGAVIVI